MSALQPGPVREVRLNEEEGIATVIVHDQPVVAWRSAKRGKTPVWPAPPDGMARRHSLGRTRATTKSSRKVWTEGDAGGGRDGDAR